MKIKDINEEGKISLLCLITKCDSAKTQKNTPYLSLTLQDSTGELDAKFWNLTEEATKQYKTGQVVEAVGDIIYHKNAPQLRVRRLNVIEDADVSEYVRQAELSRPQMEQIVDEMIDSMENPVIQTITKEIIDSCRNDFFTYPAAVKNHHNFVGGLAYHSITMARAARMLRTLYPWLDYDLLIAGILLHDAGKVEEYSSAVLPEYTTAGNLIGHISMVNNAIDRIAYKNGWQNEEDVVLLKHMVLSHHGKQEYGSPVVPMIPEAEMLSFIDNLDARMYMMKNIIDSTKPGTFGPRTFALENRMIYHRKEKGDEQE